MSAERIRWLSLAGAADLIGTSKRAVHAAVHAGRLRAFPVFGSRRQQTGWIIWEDDAIAFKAQNKDSRLCGRTVGDDEDVPSPNIAFAIA